MSKQGLDVEPFETPLPKIRSGNLEARVVERGEILCDFQKSYEDPNARLQYSRIRLYSDDQLLRFGVALILLAADSEDGAHLRTLLALILAGCCELNPYEEYFWECSSVSLKTRNSAAYEFVCINAPHMHKRETDAQAFQDKFVNSMDTSGCLQFMTPSPTQLATNLLVPVGAPGVELPVYRSIASFFRGAPKEQIDNLLKLLGSQSLRRLRDRGDPTLPLWISTAGYDLAWMHVRLDNKPKYYRFKQYKMHVRGGGLKSLREGRIQACVVQVGRTACDFTKEDEEPCATVPFTRVRFFNAGVPLMFGEVLELWVGDCEKNPFLDPVDVQSMRILCVKVFSGCFWERKEYFWECRPVSEESLMTTVFEFVAIMAPEMHKQLTDESAFEEEFEDHKGTVDCLQIMTRSPHPKETNLFVPSHAPGTALSVYRSFRSFYEGAPKEQLQNMFELLGRGMPERMKLRGDPRLPLYLSTAGYDLAWIHIRLDDMPQYYRFKDYKDNVDFYQNG